jgi:hypothetical protein
MNGLKLGHLRTMLASGDAELPLGVAGPDMAGL